MSVYIKRANEKFLLRLHRNYIIRQMALFIYLNRSRYLRYVKNKVGNISFHIFVNLSTKHE